MNQEDILTRDRILKAAFALFLAKGYDNTSVQAIIDAVGIAKGTFYHHFKSKEEMLVDMVEAMSQRVVDAVTPIVDDPHLNAIEKMLAVSRASVSQKAQDFGPQVVLLAQQMRQRSNRLLADSIDKITTQWIAPLYVRILKEGVQQGVFRIRDPEVAAELILGMIVSTKDKMTDLMVKAASGVPDAVDRIMVVYQSIEEALERILGTPPGTLPIYTCIDLRALFASLTPGGQT